MTGIPQEYYKICDQKIDYSKKDEQQSDGLRARDLTDERESGRG